jgi:hypothetical protein
VRPPDMVPHFERTKATESGRAQGLRTAGLGCMTGIQDRAIAQRSGLGVAAAGVIAAVALAIVLNELFLQGAMPDPQLGELLSYLVVWPPLFAGLLAFGFLVGSGSLLRDIGLRFHPLDLL